MSPDVMADARRRLGTRVRVYYVSRVLQTPEGPLNVFGDNESGVDDVMTAHVVGRLLGISPRHLILQGDGHPRPVAIHLRSVRRVTTPLLGVR